MVERNTLAVVVADPTLQVGYGVDRGDIVHIAVEARADKWIIQMPGCPADIFDGDPCKNGNK